MTTSRSAVLLDAPPGPRWLTHPLPVDRSGAGLEAVELAESAGLTLDPWQADALHVMLTERPDGKWAARQCGLIVPRQNGKGSVLEARELAGLFLFGEKLIIHSAHEFATSAEAFLRLMALIENTPDLDRLVARVHKAHGAEGIELLTGQRIKFKTRTGGGGRGFSGDLIVLDEAYNLPAKMLKALGPTMNARPNPQIVLTSSAPHNGDPISDELRRFCHRGREGSDRFLAYIEYAADTSELEGLEGDDLVAALRALNRDRRAWAQANPGYPFRIDDDAIESLLSLLGDDDDGFRLECLGIWEDPADKDDRLIPQRDWSAALNVDSRIVGPVCLALEVAEDRAWSSFAAAGASTLGGFHGEVVEFARGTSWCVRRAGELCRRWGVPLHVAKGSPAASLVKDLKAEGVEVVELGVDDQARAAGHLFDLITDSHTFHHIGQEPLDIAVRGAASRPSGDAWLLSRRNSSTDVSPLVAVAMAVHAVVDGVDLLSQIL